MRACRSGCFVAFCALWLLGCKERQRAPETRECSRGIVGCGDNDPAEMQKKLVRFQNELKVDDDKLAEASAAVSAAQTDADRAAANDRLQALQKQRQELIERIAALRTVIDKVERFKGQHISKECMENPLAKGCS